MLIKGSRIKEKIFESIIFLKLSFIQKRKKLKGHHVFHHKSLKFQILSMFLISIIIACTTISIVTYKYSSQSIIDKVQQNYGTIAYQSATNISYKFNSEKKKTELLAGNYIINADGVSINEKLGFLSKQASRNESIALCVFPEQGDILSSNLQSYSVADKEFYLKALSGNTTMSNVLVEKDNAFVKMNIYYATPIYKEDGDIEGVLVNIKDAKEISLYLGNINISNNSETFIIDKDNNIIAHKNIQKVIDKTNVASLAMGDTGIKELMKDIEENKNGFGTYSIQEIPTVVGYSQIEGTQYTLIIQSPSKEMLGDIDSLQHRTIAILLICIIICSIIIFLILNKELTPIRIIAKNAEDISNGILPLKDSAHTNKNNEIGILSMAFHRMVDKIKMIMENLKYVSNNIYSIGEELDKTSKINLTANEEISRFMESIVQDNEDQIVKVNTGNELLELLTNNLDVIHLHLTLLNNQSDQIQSYIANSRDISNDLIDDSISSIKAGKNMRNSLNETSSSAKHIEHKLGEIAKITKQINLVSLNAQIEAARITNGNNSFHVVAKEINNLSQETANFTSDIKKMVYQLNDNVKILNHNLDILFKINEKQNQGTKTNLEHFMHIQKSVLDINDKIGMVKESSLNISQEKDQIIDHFNHIAVVTNKNKEKIDDIKEKITKTKEITAILTNKASDLTEESAKLSTYSSFFK